MLPSSVTVLVLLSCAVFARGQEPPTEPPVGKLLKKFPPFKPFIRPFRPWGSCCTKGSMWISLYGSGSYHGSVPGIGRPVFTQQSVPNTCDTMALLKVNFNPLPRGTNGCVREPVCRRRMLQVDLFLHSKRKDYLFNIGDSSTNNGFGGDSGTQSNDAEIQGHGKNIGVYKSDKCRRPKPKPPLSFVHKAIGPGVNQIRLYLSNEFVRIQNNKGFDRQYCSECLFGLNGQADKEGNKNYDLHVALNRVVKYTSRRGYGTCLARLKWVCPCDY